MTKEKKEMLSHKYSFVFDGSKRIYVIPISNNFQNLECCTPKLISIDGITIKNSSWNNMLTSLLSKLIKKYDKDLLEFVPSWKDYHPFDKIQYNNFYVEIGKDLYLYRNFDADHAYRMIYEVCTYLGVDISKAYILLHRTPFGEPKEVIEEFSKETKEAFRDYLKCVLILEEKRCNKIINNIDTIMNQILSSISKSYNNWFMFTEKQYVINYVNRFMTYLEKESIYNEKSNQIMKRYLQYLNDFYKLYLD